ncbi:MAG: glycoside hydrolase family 3 C-terminal domain-containing protein [Chitinophagaceae bacterium]|nr:glycoside hydrolase family 3 C-terminal domain-containing protein [Chitinophagaceae bacterium]
MGRRSILLLYILTACYSLASSQNTPAYKDKTQPTTVRVQDLLSRMTPEEKFWQLFMIPGDLDPADSTKYKNGLFGFQVSATAKGDAGGQMLDYSKKESADILARKINAIQKYFTEKTRLGIPIIPFDEALHGLVRDGATVFPQAIALAATWDTALMNKAANVIADEARERGIRQVLSPVINIASDPRWGRTEETYGEDPLLTSFMGVAFVKAFEQKSIITTPKHFIANVGDGGRDSYPIHLNESLLEEIYFPPFKACIEQGGSRSIMTAYNSLDGTASSSNAWLLQEKLKKQWGFTGFVISDANAVGGEVVLHHTAKDYPASGEHAVTNGLDVIFQTEYKHHELFIPPFLNNSISQERINDAVARVLKAKFELGLFENPYVDAAKISATNTNHKAIALQAACESIVLLKNAKNTLPLSTKLKTIAVISEDAVETRLGGYSGPGNQPVSILDGIKQKLTTGTKVLFAPGCGRSSEEFMTVPAILLRNKNAEGLLASYYNNISLTGEPVLQRTDPTVDFHWTLYAPTPALPDDFYSVRWTGELLSPATGVYKIGLEGNDGYRLFINEKLVVDQWQKESYHRSVADFSFEKGKHYAIRIEFYEPAGNATIKLIWNLGVPYNWKKKIQEAVDLAKQSDVAIVTVGIKEGEFQDRALLSLPGHQEELITAVAATGKPVVVLLVGGSAITMNNWIEKIPAIVDVWYPGEEGGHAIADVLFGDYNPAGRLPITFPLHEAQLPLVYNHKPTGRGDDYNNLSGQPLFPFGYGLSYSTFVYSDMKLERNTINASESTTVTFSIKNTSVKDGDEVVQLYIRDLLSSVARPVMELKGFQRIHLKAGESKSVSFTITPDMLSMLDVNLKKITEPGEFRIMVGASSRDIRLKGMLIVK